jgi:hypothetical protein
MRILVIEDDIGSSTDVILDLVEAGHRVVRCQPVGSTVDPCTGLTGATCPLDEPVDATVQVHDGEDDITTRELGVVCAGRAGIPIVNVGTARSRVATVRTTGDRLLDTLAALEPSERSRRRRS